jgi:hypothetical protein
MTTGNYILFDAARIGDEMDELKKLGKENESLYKTKEESLLQSVAPYLFVFAENTQLGDFYFSNGWGKSWGVLVFSPAGFKELHKHFRRFLTVKTEDGTELYFRFYDPRVLRIFLPTCDTGQLVEFFGPIQYFLVEDATEGWGIKFWLENGHLKSKQIAVEEIRPNAVSAPPPTSIGVIVDAKENIPPEKFAPNPTNPLPAKPTPSPPKKPNWDMFD